MRKHILERSAHELLEASTCFGFLEGSNGLLSITGVRFNRRVCLDF